ncbi:MAG: acyl-CoA desaturase [Chitinophagaceae bacterium]|nr:MAG: acyl-CoA desaturase [Chitinophagaceae bacterium]
MSLNTFAMPQADISRKGAVKFINKERSLFFLTAKKRVDEYFQTNKISKLGDKKLFLKTIVLLFLYFAPFVIMLIFPPGWLPGLALWLIMGFAMAGLGMSVMHDANHGAYASNPKLNLCMSHVLNLMGGSTVNWKLQHNILHHTYTNITGMDDDIANKPALRLSPHSPRNPSHRYQWWHAFFLYGLTTLYWATAKDFAQWVRYRRNRVNAAPERSYRLLLVKLIIDKLLYFFVFLVVPTLFFNVPFTMVITGFLLMHFFAGVVLTVIFQLAHSLEGTTHPMPDTKGVIENDWAIHQMHTTMNFSPGNKWLSWYVGGLNFQVEHHLFPRISHIHYPAIAPIVKATAREFDIPYLENISFID